MNAPAFGLAGVSQRLPPANTQAEQHLLGGLLANNRAFDRCAEILRPEHFADPVHGAIYACAARRLEAGQVADVITLRSELENSDLLRERGGVAYLAELLVANVSVLNVGEYARLIRDAWARRQVIEACSVAANAAFGLGDGREAGEIVAELDGALSAVAQGQDAARLQDSGAVANRAVEDFLAAVDRRGAVAGVTTGYAGLDRKLGGMRAGQLLILGGRPGMGKTAMLWGVAARAAAAGHRVLFVSAEMVPHDVMARGVAAVAGLPLAAVMRGGMLEPGSNRFQPFARESAEVGLIANAARRLAALPVQWDGSDAPELAAVRARARRMARQRGGGLDMVVIDYLGRLRGSNRSSEFGRYAEVSELARGCKTLARELAVPVLVGAQLNRANVKTRENPRPQLSDLRDSGEVEQEADVVMFLHREHYYLEQQRPTRGPKQSEDEHERVVAEWYERLHQTRGEAELSVAKQRQGALGTVRLRFDPTLTWFFDVDDPDGAAVPGLGE